MTNLLGSAFILEADSTRDEFRQVYERDFAIYKFTKY